MTMFGYGYKATVKVNEGITFSIYGYSASKAEAREAVIKALRQGESSDGCGCCETFRLDFSLSDEAIENAEIEIVESEV